MADERFSSFEEFYPYYLSEHNVPRDRHLHFVGTTLFLLTVVLTAPMNPMGTFTVVSAVLIVGTFTREMDAKQSSLPILGALILSSAVLHPPMLFGVLFAYFFAWVGHFFVEKNRPATFTYPMWSLRGDFRMYGEMLRGRLWTGSTKTEG